MDERGWGVIGAGRVARRFARAIGEAPGHRVLAVNSRTQEGADEFIRELEIDAVTVGSIEMLLDTGVDFVYVASPNNLHAEHIAQARAAGVAVLCEKPIAASAAAARDILEGLRTPGSVVGVAFQYRQHPAHVRARQLVLSGVLGDIRMVEVTACLPALDVPSWYDDPRVTGGGILPMSGVHRVDLARHIIGQNFVEVSALTAHYRGAVYDDTAAITTRFEGGAIGVFLFGLDSPFGDDRIAIHGTAGSLFIESTMSQWWSDAPGTVTLRNEQGLATDTFDNIDNYLLQVESFARFADGHLEGEFATVEDAVAVAEFTEGVYSAAADGRVVILSDRH